MVLLGGWVLAKLGGREAWGSVQALRTSPLRGGREGLSEKVSRAIYLIDAQVSRLNTFYNRLVAKDKQLFEKIVDACVKHDDARARMYATELAEVRRVCKALLWAKISLEQVSIRLKTVKGVGDVVANVAPAIGIVRKLGKDISEVMPEAGKGLSELSDALASLATDVGIKAPDIEAADEDALRILEQAAKLAEQKMSEAPQKSPATREGA